MACSSTASTSRAASKPSCCASSASTLTVDEAHDLFLGKTVDGVLDAIAERTGKRPSAAFVYNWAFATAHAFKRELAAGAVRARRRSRSCAAADTASPSRRSRRWRACVFRSTSPGSRTSSAHTSTSPRWCRGPKPAPDIYLHAARTVSATPPADCIVIEDSPAGAAAARAAGFRVIGYAPGETASAMRSTGVAVIHSMDELMGTFLVS